MITRRILWKRSTSPFETDLEFLELARAIWPRSYTELLSWRPAWFVHVDGREEFPRFVRTREVLAAAGQYVGPFENGRAAEKFVTSVEETFDLCREYSCLRRSPHGEPCSYRQMGRCLGPCDGSIPMEEYRAAVARAGEFASGARGEYRAELRAEMKAAAGRLEFERAARLKTRLERLAEFDAPGCRHVAPAEEFRFLLFQIGAGRQQAKAFLVDCGAVLPAGVIAFPPRPAEIEKLLEGMASLADKDAPVEEAGRWRMGLVSHYLYAGEERRGLFLRWWRGMAEEEIIRAVEDSAEKLRLKAKLPRRGNKTVPASPPAGENRYNASKDDPAGDSPAPSLPRSADAAGGPSRDP
jgi:hypothetical protein